MNNYNKPKQSPEVPQLLRMLHPTSGQQGFSPVPNQPAYPVSPPVDPRYAAINRQAQQAIYASGYPAAYQYQNPMIPMASPYMYGIYQPYATYLRRS